MTGNVTSFNAAQQADVGQSAASRVFSDARASKANQEKMRRAADTLDRQRSRFARGLVMGSSIIADSKVLMSGGLNATTNFVERPRLLAEQIAKFTNVIDADRACGFSTFTCFGAVDPDLAYAKLCSLSDGAKL
jgi:hypothetical protein